MTAIQENNYKRINTQKLFKDFKVSEKNLNMAFGDLRIDSGYIYNQVNDVFKDIDIIDMAIDRCNTLYLVDKEQNLYTYHINENVLENTGRIGGIFSLALNTISAIGVDRDTVYIADYISKSSTNQTDRDDARLIALAKRDLQIRWILSTDPDGDPLNKIRIIECDNLGKIYILDEKKKKIFYISTCGICYPAFSPFNLKDNEKFNPENGSFEPENLVVDVDDVLYVLFVNADDGANTVSETKGYILKVLSTKKEKSAGTVEQKIPISKFSPSGIAVDASKQIFIGEYRNGDLLNKIYRLSNEICTPVASYQGAGRKLISDSKGNLYVINDENKLTLLVRKKSNMQDDKGYFEGIYISKPIDSQTSRTRWHRLLLEGNFENGTQVDFLYYVSDDRLPDDEIENLSPENWHNCVSKASAIQGNNKRDALFLDDVQGRYLWFKLILSGNEVLSPVIKSITVFFPRTSYLDYLPAIYQEDSVSRGLLERFLAIFESIFFEIDFTIEHIGRFFETYGAPPEFLSWLGSWLAVSIDKDWPEDKKRLFIRNAVSLYKKRGTREGLEESIELFTGKKPFIVESFQAPKARTESISRHCYEKKPILFPAKENIFFPPGEATVKICPDKIAGGEGEEVPLINTLYRAERFGFCVLLTDPDLDITAQSRIRRIIEEQKPAHTSYELKVLEPRFYLDMHTYLEINTVVTKPEFILEKTSMLGRDTVLHDEEQAGQIERHSRAGMDILLS
ncbi:MAG: phage tail protein [Methanosarcina sp.]